MSLERRQYDARSRIIEQTEEPLPVVVAWDEEASHTAITQAHSAAVRDPDASQYLMGQVLAQVAPPAIHIYDPARIYTEMLLVAGLKKRDIDEMHFVHFFGQRREVILAKEREKNFYSDPANQPPPYDQ